MLGQAGGGSEEERERRSITRAVYSRQRDRRAGEETSPLRRHSRGNRGSGSGKVAEAVAVAEGARK